MPDLGHAGPVGRRAAQEAIDNVNPTDGSVEEPANWRWLYADVAGVVLSEPAVVFASQQAAEDWLSENFQELSDDGVGTVTLMNGERAVYGPMYLTPDGDGPVAEAEI